ncbi:hypothetical protein GBV73_08170 [Thermococcus sp. 101 C5]|uniref:hypothetical protein n=1 Tax=Thermococcus sp. 101 C5 TaxID=2654197 RepID=UPI00128DA750|nr:hypothetical protein [Thermococcus sp. 101 C5]MPW39646.1 hypothetical protein [Thermococcus sp. 101 C5]
MRIARAGDFWMEIPNVRYSFFDTPYIGHRLGRAVDVYFEDKALFPFEEGKLVEVKKIKTPRYISVEHDYLTLFKVGDFCLKVLHVKPELEVGERVTLGDEIGRLIYSGFFSPWSDKHAHFELRRCEDPYRARGGLVVFPKVMSLVPTAKGIEFEVVEKTSQYLWLKPLKRGKEGMTPFGNVEGGLPHYRYGAIFNGSEARLFGRVVKAEEILENRAGIFKANFGVLANGKMVKGVGVYCNEGRVKLIGGEFEVGDVVELVIV